jgi:hypothetical protein
VRLSGGLADLDFLLSRGDEGLVEGFGSGSPIKSLSLLLLAWISPAAVAVEVAKLEV